ncbi:hypothetical protein FKM82_001112 [Ascaphus truei]
MINFLGQKRILRFAKLHWHILDHQYTKKNRPKVKCILFENVLHIYLNEQIGTMRLVTALGCVSLQLLVKSTAISVNLWLHLK